MFNVFCCFIIKLLLLFAVVSTCSSVISLHLLWFIHMTPCKTMWVSYNISTNKFSSLVSIHFLQEVVENLMKDQRIFRVVIILIILIASSFDYVSLLIG